MFVLIVFVCLIFIYLIFRFVGKQVIKLTHQRLMSVNVTDVAVSKSGDKMAVACGAVRLFRISRKALQ